MCNAELTANESLDNFSRIMHHLKENDPSLLPNIYPICFPSSLSLSVCLPVAAVANAMPDFHRSMKDSLRTPEQGADTVVWLAVSEAATTNPSGHFYQGMLQN